MKEREFLHALGSTSCGSIPDNSLQARCVLALAKQAGATFESEGLRPLPPLTTTSARSTGAMDRTMVGHAVVESTALDKCEWLTKADCLEVLRRCKAVEEAVAHLRGYVERSRSIPSNAPYSGDLISALESSLAILEGTK
jgi:hypothetical protein